MPVRVEVELDAGVVKADERFIGERVVADRADHPHARTEPRGRDRLVRALPARHAQEVVTGERLPRPRQPLDARDEVEVDRADDGELGGHAAA